MEPGTGTGDERGRLREAARCVYGAAPDDFVEERERLARELRDDGDGDLAGEIGRLRKPTLAAWAVDQLTLRDGDDVARLFELGDAARGTLQGDDRPVREVMADLRRAVADLRDRAGRYLQDIGAASEAHLDDIERTLTTAAVDPERRPDVAAGMLTRPLPASGFGALTGLELSALAPSEGRHERDTERSRRRFQEERDKLERQSQRVRDRRDDAQRRATGLRARAADAQREADECAAELAEVEDRLREVSEELDAV